MAAATLYRERFDDTPGIVYAAGVDHAYNLATAFRAAGVKAEAVSGPDAAGEARRDPRRLRARRDRRPDQRDAARRGLELAARDRRHAPRADRLEARLPAADRPDHAHPPAQGGRASSSTSSRRRRRTPSASSRCTRCSNADFYREGARVTPAPRRRTQRRARRKLTPANWLVPVTPDVARRLAVIQREWQRIDPKYLDDDEQRFWATIAGRQMRFDERQTFVQKFTERGASKGALETFLATCAAQNPNRRLRLIALADRVSMRVDRADFDDLVTLVTQAPPWEKDRAAGVRILLRAIAEGKPDAPEQILARWTWRLARAVRKTLDRKASQEYPDAKRLLGALANSRGNRHEENAARLVKAALEMPRRGRRGAARDRRGLHAAGDEAARRGARAARGDRRRSRARSPTTCPRRRPARRAQAPPAPAAEAAGRGGRRGSGRRRRRRLRAAATGGRRRGPARAEAPPQAPPAGAARSRHARPGRPGRRPAARAAERERGLARPDARADGARTAAGRVRDL